VEFALVVPVFLITLFAICQWGIIFMSYLALRNASSVGGRQAILTPGDTNAIIAAATSAAGPLLQTNASLLHVAAVPISLFSDTTGTSVTVTYNLHLVVPFVVPPFVGSATIASVGDTS
jgi:Flp pilus assembly protein TadG